jgi:hypothetical protein
LVPDGTPVQLGEPVAARIWVKDKATGKKVLSDNRVIIPEGWYALPDTGP